MYWTTIHMQPAISITAALACRGGFQPQSIVYFLQAAKGAFSAYAYEVLPLLHTLLGHNKLETDTFSADTLAFLSGYKGHITAVLRDVAANAKRGLKGSGAASVKGHADSLIKVCAYISLSLLLSACPCALSALSF